MALRTSGDSTTSAAAKMSSSWSSRVTPTMVEATKSCCLDQAVARVTRDMPASAAIADKRSVVASDFSLTKRRAIAPCRPPISR